MILRSRPRQLLVASLLVALAAAAVPIAQRLDGYKVNSVRVAGDFRHVSRDALETVVADQITKGFFEVDVEAVRAASRALPWVREASVRRVWPDSLHVAIVERQPVARWNDETLVEADGSLFEPHGRARDLNLPMLAAPRWVRWVVESRACDCSNVAVGAWCSSMARRSYLPRGRGLRR